MRRSLPRSSVPSCSRPTHARAEGRAWLATPKYFTMARRQNVPSCSLNQLDVIEEWLNEDFEEEDDQLPISQQNDRITHSENEFSDVEENLTIASDHETDSDISGNEDGEDISEKTDEGDRAGGYYYGKNKFKWAITPPARNSWVRSHNIIVRLPGTTTASTPVDPYNPKEAFDLIFDNSMIEKILYWTNKKLYAIRLKYKTPDRTELKDCTRKELECFIGLLLYTAVFKSNHEAIASLFATDGTGREIFRLCMSAMRVYMLLICLRFDDPEEREERKKTDPGCIVTELVDIFNTNAQAHYTMGANGTIDEMLLGFRGRCSFKMYIPSKPNKYGLKMQCLADSKTHYVFNTYLYCGKNTDGRTLTDDEKKKPIPVQACLRLCKPIYNTNRNITTDNWYTSIDLITTMQSKGLTVVGTLRKNKREIPKEFLPNKDRSVGSSRFGYTKDMTIVSYVPKKNKSVILVSSTHHDQDVDEVTNKPEIIMYYNSTKGGVDTVDQMCSVYSSSRRTRRWPMPVFYRLLDMSGLNAFIIQQSHAKVSKMSRMVFVKGLAKLLSEPHMKERCYNTRLPTKLRMNIAGILQVALPGPQIVEDMILERNKRKRCSFCPSNKRAKTAHLCVKCKQSICMTCSKTICKFCI